MGDTRGSGGGFGTVPRLRHPPGGWDHDPGPSSISLVEQADLQPTIAQRPEPIIDLLKTDAFAASWVAIVVANKSVGFALLPLALIIAILPDIIAYVATHLRYDTTWYVLTPCSLRIRCGVWEINEITVTFENVQNVKVKQGPVQRAFGIANVIIETSGAGGGDGLANVSNQAMIEGIDDAYEIRDQIMTGVKRSATTGLGDEHADHAQSPGWSRAHLTLMREIRDAI